VMWNLAVIYAKQGKLDQAQQLAEQGASASRRVLGAEDGDTLLIMLTLASIYQFEGKNSEALELVQEVLATSRRILREEDPITLRAKHVFASGYADLGRLEEAQQLLEELVPVARRVFGPEDSRALAVTSDLAQVYQQRYYKLAESRKIYEEVLRVQRRELGPDHPETINILNRLAWLLATCADAKVRDGPSALRLAEEAVAATGRTNDWYLDTLAAAYAETRQFAQAVKAQREATVVMKDRGLESEFASRQRLYEAGYPFREYDASAVERLRLEGKMAEVETIEREQLTIRQVTLGKEHPSAADSLAELTRTLLAEEKFDEAESSARECLAIRERALPDDWRTFAARSLLGGCLLRQKKYAEAEPALLSGYEGMHQRETVIPPTDEPRLREASQRLVQLYEATDRPDQAARWKQKLAEFEKAHSEKKPVGSKP
jgi:eukaryotic-like serine/threonine-protein kinase